MHRCGYNTILEWTSSQSKEPKAHPPLSLNVEPKNGDESICYRFVIVVEHTKFRLDDPPTFPSSASNFLLKDSSPPNQSSSLRTGSLSPLTVNLFPVFRLANVSLSQQNHLQTYRALPWFTINICNNTTEILQ